MKISSCVCDWCRAAGEPTNRYLSRFHQYWTGLYVCLSKASQVIDATVSPARQDTPANPNTSSQATEPVTSPSKAQGIRMSKNLAISADQLNFISVITRNHESHKIQHANFRSMSTDYEKLSQTCNLIGCRRSVKHPQTNHP